MRELPTTDPAVRPPFVRSGDWWPGGLGHPNDVGAQYGLRYAYFTRARRLAIERDGVVTLYDTQDHEFSGLSPQQSLTGGLRFDTQAGQVDVTSLPLART